MYRKIEIPEGIGVEISGNEIKISGKEGEIGREFSLRNMEFRTEGNEIIIGGKKLTKKEKKLMNTIVAHIKNMIKGVQNKFEYSLKICYSHFPISLDIKGRDVLVKNFLGEKIPRKMKLPEGVEIEAGKEIIKIKSINKELAGQAAANFETLLRIRKKDLRVFQDGIFIINKAGKEI